MVRDFRELPTTRKVITIDALEHLRDDQNVLTCGCFSWLHLGHVKLFADAKSHGSRLFVAMNS
ncbi:MAG: hypothetical protein PHV42_03445, partial [Candidatus Pacebacteria bacterium]|nr:hypothetical protein [Candidatus Paceibacterota bacterium]